MNIILFDDTSRNNLLPFTYTRPTGAIRCGILTPAERWELMFESKVSFLTQEYLSNKFKTNIQDQNLLINGSIIPDNLLLSEVKELKLGESLIKNDLLIAVVLNSEQVKDFSLEIFNHTIKKETNSTGYIYINRIWHLFTYNDQAIRFDFKHITANRTSELLNETNTLINIEQIFVEPGAKVQGAFLNASTGPIYIAKNAEIMEGSFIRGPFALGENASTKMGTKIYGATTIGPHCKVGGEVSNSILFGYSNKGHDGFIGNAIIGEWCNIGADSNSSNLKNNYADVKVWSHVLNKFENTGLTFCGLMMADHAKCGINTMFNTATVVGVAANIFGSGFPRTFIPSFAWGGAQGFETFQLNKVIEMATQMCQRRGVDFDEIEQAIIKHVFDETVSQRYWEKQEN